MRTTCLQSLVFCSSLFVARRLLDFDRFVISQSNGSQSKRSRAVVMTRKEEKRKEVVAVYRSDPLRMNSE